MNSRDIPFIFKVASIFFILFVSVDGQEDYFGLLPLGCPSSPSPNLPPQDFNDFMYQEGDLYPLYLEWWTFSFHDDEQTLGGIINYFYVSSAIPFTSYSSVNPGIITPVGLIDENDKYSLSDFTYESNPSVTINGANGWTTDTDGSGTVNVYGQTQNGSAQWNLLFSPGMESWCWANNTNTEIGLTFLESFNWLFPSPSSTVSGNVTINGDVFQISGVGENDHVWGHFVPGVTLGHWMSAQGWSDDGQYMFYFANMNEAYGFIRLESSDDSFNFYNGDFQVSVQYDTNGRPTYTSITAQNAQGDTFDFNYQPIVPNLQFNGPVYDMIKFSGQINSNSMSGKGRSELIGGEEAFKIFAGV